MIVEIFTRRVEFPTGIQFFPFPVLISKIHFHKHATFLLKFWSNMSGKQTERKLELPMHEIFGRRSTSSSDYIITCAKTYRN